MSSPGAFDADPATARRFGWHPHSGIATTTVVLEGSIAFAETTGRQGTLGAGGVEWMRAAGGVSHCGTMDGERRVVGFQLWTALGPELESGPPESYYLKDEEVPADGSPSHGSKVAVTRLTNIVQYEIERTLVPMEFRSYLHRRRARLSPPCTAQFNLQQLPFSLIVAQVEDGGFKMTLCSETE